MVDLAALNFNSLNVVCISYLNDCCSGCFVTRLNDSGLELIVKKWSHSLVEVDLAWSSATEPLDAAVIALSEQGSSSRLRYFTLI